MASVTDVQFEHYRPQNAIGVHESKPRLSWKIQNAPNGFRQSAYEIEISDIAANSPLTIISSVKLHSSDSILVPWPNDEPLRSRQKVCARVRVWNHDDQATEWSPPAFLETGLLDRAEWRCERIAAPWGPGTSEPDPEQLYRKDFSTTESSVAQARLYITAQGVYEAEINGQRVGDHFLAPGWTSYDGRLQYQTYDVTSLLSSESRENCLGVRVAEGWFSGRIGFEGGHRNIWGPHTSLLAQLEITYSTGLVQRIETDGSWLVIKGPIQLAEIYDGEKYDVTKEIPDWSSSGSKALSGYSWAPVLVLDPLPKSVELTAGFSEPVRRIETIQPVGKHTSPSGKTILDFGQNLVGYLRLSNISGERGRKIRLSHAEVLENGELAIRPLRICKAIDEYTLRGDKVEQYEPRFTFHGFRYAQIDGWSGEDELSSIEAVVCHTEMKSTGSFSCSDPLLDKLYSNICWGMRGNFLSVPTDCPQRDERLGWTGDLAVFVPTATLIYDIFGIVKNWLIDVEYDQHVLDGVPPMVSPNATLPDPIWCRRKPCAIWHDVTILAPWELYQETGDKSILRQQYNSMVTWIKKIPRNKKAGKTHLWDPSIFQLGDWLDPNAPPDQPWKGATDAKMVSNMFLVHSLELMVRISAILEQEKDEESFKEDAIAARNEFQAEYVTPNGRITSDSQTAYALAICFDLLTALQRETAAERLVELVRKNNFRIGTGFAGTPFICEALASTGNIQVAYAMLLEKKCPSWLYPVTMGATTVWERWDSLLPDGSVNPGEMTSFNHYAFGAVAKLFYERIAGLRRLEPGWRKCRIEPCIGAEFTTASASHDARTGTISCSWAIEKRSDGTETFRLTVSLPCKVTAEVVVPGRKDKGVLEIEGPGNWTFDSVIERDYDWPIPPLPPKS